MRPSKSRIIYTMPSNKHGDGIIKKYSRIEVELNKDMVGSLGLGFGDNTNRLSIEDKRELDNLITILQMASKSLDKDEVKNLQYGEKIEVGLFNSTLKKEKYDQ